MPRIVTILVASVALTSLYPMALAADICEPHRTTPQSLNQTDQAVIRALSDKNTTSTQLASILTQAEGISPREQKLSPFLRDLALVQMSAMDLQAQQYQKARAQLIQIPLQSDQSIAAGLMIAESYLLEGSTDKAVAWYVRIADRYPEEEKALRGLVYAGQVLESIDRPAEAHALYKLAMNKALEIAANVRTIRNNYQDSPSDFLLKRKQGESSHLKRQIMKTMATTAGSSFLAMDRTAKAAEQRLGCLLVRTAEFRSRRDRLEQADAEAAERQAALSEELAQQQAKLRQQARLIEPNGFSTEQVALRKQVRSLRQSVLRNELALQVLEENRATIPVITRQIDQDMQSAQARLSKLHEQTSQKMNQAFDQACQRLEHSFQNVGGEAASRLAEVEILARGKR